MGNGISDLHDQLSVIINDGLTAVVDGAREDIKRYAEAIATDAARVAEIPDADRRDAVLKELIGQTRLVAEINRVRAVNEGWEAVERVVTMVVKIIVVAVTKAV